MLLIRLGKTAVDVPRWGPNMEEFVKRFDTLWVVCE